MLYWANHWIFVIWLIFGKCVEETDLLDSDFVAANHALILRVTCRRKSKCIYLSILQSIQVVCLRFSISNIIQKQCFPTPANKKAIFQIKINLFNIVNLLTIVLSSKVFRLYLVNQLHDSFRPIFNLDDPHLLVLSIIVPKQRSIIRKLHVSIGDTAQQQAA